MVEPNAGIIDPVFAIWRLAVAVAELAGLEFGARVRRAHVEGHLVRACPGTCYVWCLLAALSVAPGSANPTPAPERNGESAV